MDPKIKETAHAAGLSEEDRRLILAMPERHDALTLAADWDAMNEDYAEDVLVMMPGFPDMRGRTALRAFQESFPPLAVSELQIDDLDGCGDMAYARLTYRYELETEEGTLKDSGRALWILRRGPDGKWRVTLDISNSDQASAPPGSGE
ncbi:MAG: DUF4440 domain-containing protein [Longimicrobiales bacterium]